MKIIRLYTGEDGESHFEDIEISLEDGGKIVMLSRPQKAAGIIFRETADDYNYDWHNAPRKQYIVLNHGKLFKSLMSSYLPDWEAILEARNGGTTRNL